MPARISNASVGGDPDSRSGQEKPLGVPAARFVFGESEHPVRGGVPAHDAELGVPLDDGKGGLIDELGKTSLRSTHRLAEARGAQSRRSLLADCPEGEKRPLIEEIRGDGQRDNHAEELVADAKRNECAAARPAVDESLSQTVRDQLVIREVGDNVRFPRIGKARHVFPRSEGDGDAQARPAGRLSAFRRDEPLTDGVDRIETHVHLLVVHRVRDEAVEHLVFRFLLRQRAADTQPPLRFSKVSSRSDWLLFSSVMSTMVATRTPRPLYVVGIPTRRASKVDPSRRVSTASYDASRPFAIFQITRSLYSGAMNNSMLLPYTSPRV